MNENNIKTIKQMRRFFPNGSVKVLSLPDSVLISVSDGKFSFESSYAVANNQDSEAVLELALNDVTAIFSLDAPEIPMPKQRRTKVRTSDSQMDIVPLVSFTYEDSPSLTAEAPAVAKKIDTTPVVQAPEPNDVSSVEDTAISDETDYNPVTTSGTETVEQVVPRRRRRAADLYSEEELAALMVSTESITGKPSVDEKKTDKQLPNQMSVDEVLERAEEVVSNVPAMTDETLPVNNSDSVIPPSSKEEDLERALGYVITIGMDSGHTLGELPEIHGRDAAIEKLNWLAYKYRGRDFELKNSAEIVLRALTA